jgi:hypothetical protein
MCRSSVASDRLAIDAGSPLDLALTGAMLEQRLDGGA